MRKYRLRPKTPPAPLDDGVNMLRPIVQHTRSDVGTVGPDKRAQLFIDARSPEQVPWPTHWSKHPTGG